MVLGYYGIEKMENELAELCDTDPTIHAYNNMRIHTKLKMSPAVFAKRHERSDQLLELVS